MSGQYYIWNENDTIQLSSPELLLNWFRLSLQKGAAKPAVVRPAFTFAERLLEKYRELKVEIQALQSGSIFSGLINFRSAAKLQKKAATVLGQLSSWVNAAMRRYGYHG